MFAQRISPVSKLPWEPPILSGLQPSGNHRDGINTARVGDGRTETQGSQSLRRTPVESAGGGGGAHGAASGGQASLSQVNQSLPPGDTDFSKWLVGELRNFLQVRRISKPKDACLPTQRKFTYCVYVTDSIIHRCSDVPLFRCIYNPILQIKAGSARS